MFGRESRHRQSSHKSVIRAKESLELIHSDLCGPIDPTIYEEMNYYILFIDDFIRMTSYLSFEEKNIDRGAGEVQRVQIRSRKVDWKDNQEIENRWRRRIREMDERSSQGIRHHSRNYRSIQPRPEWDRRKGKSNHHGESQGYHCGGKARQKTMNENRRYDYISQESQSNHRFRRRNPLRSMT